MNGPTVARPMPEEPPETPTSDRLEGIQRENAELRALLDASLGLQGELSLAAVLQNVVDSATQLLDARYGALSVIDDRGGIEQFVTCGIDAEQQKRIGPLPRGIGLLAVPLVAGEVLRLDDLKSDSRSAGFPRNHPPMTTLLAVPIICRSPHRGNLYLAEKRGQSFTEHDELTLQRFARGVATAIDTAYLHERSESLAIAEERLQISREIHDGVAQVLAYVNTKAQAARELLDRGKQEQAGEQLDQLAAAAREVYTQVREGILALRLQPTAERTLAESVRDYAEHWQQRGSTTAEVEIEGDLQLRSEVQLQIVRIIQEALTNVRKHAHATRVSIRLHRTDESVEIRVVDNGRGFSPVEPSEGEDGFGLSVMRERAEEIGGMFELETAPGRGTSVRVVLPSSSLRPGMTGGTDSANTDR